MKTKFGVDVPAPLDLLCQVDKRIPSIVYHVADVLKQRFKKSGDIIEILIGHMPEHVVVAVCEAFAPEWQLTVADHRQGKLLIVTDGRQTSRSECGSKAHASTDSGVGYKGW